MLAQLVAAADKLLAVMTCCHHKTAQARPPTYSGIRQERFREKQTKLVTGWFGNETFVAPSNVPKTEDELSDVSRVPGVAPLRLSGNPLNGATANLATSGSAAEEAPARFGAPAPAPPLRFELQARDFPKAYDTVARQVLPLFSGVHEQPAQATHAVLQQFLLLRFLEVKGWLGAPDYLRQQAQLHAESDPESQSFYQQVLAPRLRALSNANFLAENAPPPALPNRLAKIVCDTLFGPFRFTLQEVSGKEAEKLIDPEMLGLVSERQLLERPLTLALSAQTQRRISATFQTPRRVVRWMCREALLHYLQAKLAEFSQLDAPELRERLLAFFHLPPAAQMTDEDLAALNDLFLRAEAQRMSRALLACRVCDPAAGAGALLAGMLEEMAAALAKLDLQLYGRGLIQQHNYEFRLKRKLLAECLFGVDVQEQAVLLCHQRLWLALVACEQSAPDASLAVTMRESANLHALFRHVVVGDSLLGCRVFDDGAADSFKWRQAFPEIFQKRGGFDILIGNPPYRPTIPKDALEKEIWAQIGALFPYVKRSRNTAAAFFDLPRLIGALGVITCQMVPKSLTLAEGWATTRAVLRLNYNLLSAADVSEAFQGASLEQEVVIYTRDSERDALTPETPLDSNNLSGAPPLVENYTLSGSEMVKVAAAPATSAALTHLSPVGRELFDRLSRLRSLSDCVTIKRGQRWQRRQAKPKAGQVSPLTVPVIKGTNLRQFRITDELPRLEPPAYIQRVLEELRQPKLVCPNTLAHLKKPHEALVLLCALDRSGSVALDTVQQLFPNQDCPFSLEVLCGLLNSSLARWFFSCVMLPTAAVRAVPFDAAQIARLPLPRAQHRLLPQIERQVRKLLKLEWPSKYCLPGQLPEYDALDELICDLFELSPEERDLLHTTPTA